MPDKTIKVGCTIPNGIRVSLFKQGFDDGTGVKTTVRDGDLVQLNGPSALSTGTTSSQAGKGVYGVTEVKADWWAKWIEQNLQNPFVVEKMVFALEDER